MLFVCFLLLYFFILLRFAKNLCYIYINNIFFFLKLNYKIKSNLTCAICRFGDFFFLLKVPATVWLGDSNKIQPKNILLVT